MYVIRNTGSSGNLKTVGDYMDNGLWVALADYRELAAAIALVNYLNGGDGSVETAKFLLSQK